MAQPAQPGAPPAPPGPPAAPPGAQPAQPGAQLAPPGAQLAPPGAQLAPPVAPPAPPVAPAAPPGAQLAPPVAPPPPPGGTARAARGTAPRRRAQPAPPVAQPAPPVAQPAQPPIVLPNASSAPCSVCWSVYFHQGNAVGHEDMNLINLSTPDNRLVDFGGSTLGPAKKFFRFHVTLYRHLNPDPYQQPLDYKAVSKFTEPEDALTELKKMLEHSLDVTFFDMLLRQYKHASEQRNNEAVHGDDTLWRQAYTNYVTSYQWLQLFRCASFFVKDFEINDPRTLVTL